MISCGADFLQKFRPTADKNKPHKIRRTACFARSLKLTPAPRKSYISALLSFETRNNLVFVGNSMTATWRASALWGPGRWRRN